MLLMIVIVTYVSTWAWAIGAKYYGSAGGGENII